MFSEKIRQLADDYYRSTIGYDVKIDTDKIEEVSEFIKSRYSEVTASPDCGLDLEVLCELMIYNSSLQFCFWYGKSSFRPFNNNSGTILNIMKESFGIITHDDGTLTLANPAIYDLLKTSCPVVIKKALRTAGFPMLNERLCIVDELAEKSKQIDMFVSLVKNGAPADNLLEFLISNFDCFATDLFYKKALLTLNMIERYKPGTINGIDTLPVPADYQIPKVLQSLGVLKYSTELQTMINTNTIIPSLSSYEVLIRTCTIIAMDMLSISTELSPGEIDNFFFKIRNTFKNSHHLTPTTDY